LEGIETAVLIGAVLSSSLRRETISFELAVRKAQLVGGHVRSTSEHGTPWSESHPPGLTSAKTRRVFSGEIDVNLVNRLSSVSDQRQVPGPLKRG
jgi:hypothetical protein